MPRRERERERERERRGSKDGAHAVAWERQEFAEEDEGSAEGSADEDGTEAAESDGSGDDRDEEAEDLFGGSDSDGEGEQHPLRDDAWDEEALEAPGPARAGPRRGRAAPSREPAAWDDEPEERRGARRRSAPSAAPVRRGCAQRARRDKETEDWGSGSGSKRSRR